MNSNIILNVDSYKASHFLQYPPNTAYISSYIESRGGQYDKTLFFGLQMFLLETLTKPISQSDIDQADTLFKLHGVPFNRNGWQIILDKHQGYLPIEIQAVAEGTLVPVQNVLLQVVNTDPEFAWLTSYIETALLRAVWYPTTVATLSWYIKQNIKKYLLSTADTTDGLIFKLHDFGARGASSAETAAIGDVAHLVNFSGTDTVGGLLAAQRYYAENMAGFSIPAAEHSTITVWGKQNEQAAYENMLDQFSGQGKLVAVVSDSFDLWNAIDNIWGDKLKERIINSGGTLVIRPDSGDPVTVVTQTIERLMNKFGYNINSKGYRVLPNTIRVIQGDGVSPASINAILQTMKRHKQSADNIAFGMGAELLQKVNRDTLKFAMKASAAYVDEQWREVYKDPITDQGKRSKRGRLALIADAKTGFCTIFESDLRGQKNLLEPVFRNGKILKTWKFDEIRRRSNGEFDLN